MFKKIITWIEPLFTERDQVDHGKRVASTAAFLSWGFAILDASISLLYVTRTVNIPDAHALFGFLEMLTIFTWGFRYSHKLLFIGKNPLQIANTEITNGNGTK